MDDLEDKAVALFIIGLSIVGFYMGIGELVHPRNESGGALSALMFGIALTSLAFGLLQFFWKKIERGLRDIFVEIVVLILGSSMTLVAYLGGVRLGTLLLVAPLVFGILLHVIYRLWLWKRSD
ncbi:MAG TPA: hypothetical protein VE842_02645 [Pyrinomonadaceae bacterium]|jgi:hypothetical protein|nr:hypothetical protein [Pyrinomonadaceae bacterium]